MGTYAGASDVVTRWIGTGAPANINQVEIFIGDAETLIDREFPDLADTVDGDAGPTSEQVKLVVVAMVTRLYKNPDGIRSRTDASSDQFGGTVVYAGSNPGGLTITDDERVILRGGTATTTSPFSIDTAFCVTDIHADVCALRFGAAYCSCGADIAGSPIFEVTE